MVSGVCWWPPVSIQLATITTVTSLLRVRVSECTSNMRHRKLLQCLIMANKRKAPQYSTSSKIDFSGVFPPIVTPFKQDQTIAWTELESNLARLGGEPLAGYLVHGSNGEFCYLDREEKLDMVRAVRQLCGPDKLLLAGSGCEATLETIKMTEAMAEAGCDAAVVVTPCYYKGGMTAAALEVPLASAVRLARHPNILGIKDSGGDI